MKITTVIGARPQFVKAAAVSKAILEFGGITENIIHTGQHFDPEMSEIFFEQLKIPQPSVRLGISGGSHGEMTGRMLQGIEAELLTSKPDMVLLYGDTNSTLAGALAAAKIHIPVAHVEAGLRSFNMQMPEEINRILIDNVSDLLFCPTVTAVKNLENEGFKQKPSTVQLVGDVMEDATRLFSKYAKSPVDVPELPFILCTLHRAENTDCRMKLAAIVSAINDIHQNIAQVLMPLHPRTKKKLQEYGLELQCTIIPPVGYLEMLWYLQHSILVLTDSGGLQKEAFFFRKPCVTARTETEWVELIDAGVNRLAGFDSCKIVTAVTESVGIAVSDPDKMYGGGFASENIVKAFSNCHSQ